MKQSLAKVQPWKKLWHAAHLFYLVGISATEWSHISLQGNWRKVNERWLTHSTFKHIFLRSRLKISQTEKNKLYITKKHEWLFFNSSSVNHTRIIGFVSFLVKLIVFLVNVFLQQIWWEIEKQLAPRGTEWTCGAILQLWLRGERLEQMFSFSHVARDGQMWHAMNQQRNS